MKIITVSDKMQKNYRYALSEPIGKNFHPDFKPALSPAKMLEMGVFEGKYLNDCRNEFPKKWFLKADKLGKLSPKKADISKNFFGVKSRQSLREWIRKGWIMPGDPDIRGWFQWYCRYYIGRRCPDDERQIGRWKAMKRHIAQIRKYCRPGDPLCRPRQRQALLNWSYDSRRI